MSKRQGMEVSLAVAEAVKMANVDVVSAYPITPQTHIVEGLSEIVANGEVDAESICVESEHSAMSACLGSSAAGARTFTATSGQGLELMHEVVYVASGMRLPIVMAVANRALSAPLSVWGDHSDVMAVRDTGWIQVFCEDGQEAFDLTLWAFRLAEDNRVLFPVMVHLDGFHLTHVVEPIMLPSQEEVNKYLPPNSYPYALDPRKPVAHGSFAPPFIFTEAKKSQEEAFKATYPIILEKWKEFKDAFGREYKPVESYRTEDAETIFMVMGSFAETATVAIDELRAKGQKVGLVRIRLWRPFPCEELRKALKGAKVVAVMDRALSSGSIPPVCEQVRSVMYTEKDRPAIISFVAGLGGRDVYPDDYKYMINRANELAQKGQPEEFEMVGVRE